MWKLDEIRLSNSRLQCRAGEKAVRAEKNLLTRTKRCFTRTHVVLPGLALFYPDLR